ncbi:MAG: YggS family pyridoxal phosphate-dependent enzyme [Tissierellia bacterium]|nr:YggS family pyridoxal phosphate-dependent enzyme [Tissierellia bacterium]
MSIKDNLEIVLEEIEKAKSHSLTGEDVRLIAVSKNHSIKSILEAHRYGIKDIGENRVQELTSKMEELDVELNYHMIGSLQRNKVKYIYDKVELIHSLDRMRLAREIEKRASRDNLDVNCLVQINIGKEASKEGLDYSQVEQFIYDLESFDHVKIKGLMAILPYSEDEQYLRSLFRKMYKLYEKLKEEGYQNTTMNYLSMGMSGDYKLAIEEGSNMVRIGTKIFGARAY